MVISFLGHRSLQNGMNLQEKVKRVIEESVDFHEKVVFFCGGYGDFDDLCACACRSIKEKWKKCEIVFVTPYITTAQQEKIKQLINAGLYDSTIYPPLENVPYRFAISKRNEWMIDQSDLIIAYVKHSFGGAYQSLHCARRRGKQLVNLAE